MRNLETRTKGELFSSQIIAILAAILFPVFARAREKARQASCQSNLKQIGLAGAMYASDYDQWLAACNTGRMVDKWGGGPGRIWWNGLLMPYVKNYQIFACPSVDNPRFYGETEPYPTPTDSTYRFHAGYGMNWYYDAAASDRGWWAFRRESSVEAPAEKVYVGEGGNIVVGPNPGNALPYATYMANVAASTTYGFGARRHNDGANFLFVDGHVKWLKYDALFERNWNPGAP